MNFFIIGYGLSGGFGGINQYEVIKAKDLKEAIDEAHLSAREEYDRYDGMYGLQTIDEILEENPDFTTRDAEEEWEEQREGWLEYVAFPYSRAKEEELDGHHFCNPYESEAANL